MVFAYSPLEFHYLIHQVDAGEEHAAAAVAPDTEVVERARRALALLEALLELLVLIAEQLTAGESNE